MTKKYPKVAKEVRELLTNLDSGNDNHENEPGTEIPSSHAPQEPQREIYVLFVREEEEEKIIDSVAHVEDLDTAPLQPTHAESGVRVFGMVLTLLCLFCIAVQFYQIANPFTVNVSLVVKSQQVMVQGTLQLGRVFNPITISQSTTVPTSGKGHQDAKQATGYLTFLNGKFNQVDVPAGTVFTSSSGVQIITDQDAMIPAASPNPPSLGQVTVAAHAMSPGSAGNIPALDLNATVSSTLFVKNLNAFTGGQDERNFRTVAKSDIDRTSPSLVATVTQGVKAALQGQVKSNETLVMPSCATTITSDHQPGEEAVTVKVTVSETCSAIAYNRDTLQTNVTQLLNHQVGTKLGAGYSLLETPQITITGATPGKKVTLSFTTVSTWIYGISSAQQHYIKNIIAGKNTQQALQVLRSLPGIENASLQFSGFGDATRIPKNLSTIHLTIFYGM